MKLTSKDIEPHCAYCTHGNASADGKAVLCVKKGVMRPDSHCRAFVYDILKREPRVKPALPKYDKKEFEL